LSPGWRNQRNGKDESEDGEQHSAHKASHANDAEQLPAIVLWPDSKESEEFDGGCFSPHCIAC
jgi:hypothetical protein